MAIYPLSQDIVSMVSWTGLVVVSTVASAVSYAGMVTALKLAITLFNLKLYFRNP